MARSKRIKFRTRRYDTKPRIISRIRSLQQRYVPPVKFYNQFNLEELKKIRKNAKLDNDMWLFDLARMKKIANGKKK